MAGPQPGSVSHDHVFLGDAHGRNERRVWLVILLTTVTMVVEIVAGTLTGSMALTADGWHMSTHSAAMLIAALAYGYARRHARDPRFTFGTGKMGDLAGFASAVVLALVALLIGWESIQRLVAPVAIDFEQAMAVAVVGLVVNLVSAWLLNETPHHHHHHSHSHDRHDHGHHHHDRHHGARDNNLRAAYLHVLADALTSVLAIVALLLGRSLGWTWADSLMGVVGGLVILRWSWGLVRASGGVLLDVVPSDEDLPGEIRAALERPQETRITDLHVWRVGPGHWSAIVALQAAAPAEPDHYRARLRHLHALSHVTIEVQPA